MPAAQATALITQYPPEDVRVGRGIMIAVGIHLFVAAIICIILYIMGIQSLRDLLEKGGAIASSGPAPEQPMIIEIKVDDIKPPPTDHIEFMMQVLKPKPVVIIKPPPTPPKPVPKPVVKTKPHFTAPKATGSGTSDLVSGFVKGTSGFPHPGYPYEALQAGEGGTVAMRVTFDEGGNVTGADIVGSSGVTILDISTRNFVYAHWKNPSVANKIVSISIVYDPSGRSVLLRQ